MSTTGSLPRAALLAAALVCVASTSHPSSTAPVRAWVFFEDKGPNVAAALAGPPPSALTPRALARRARRRTAPGLFDERDLPPHAGYVAALRQAGALVWTQSRWLNAASVALTRAQLERIEALPFVRRVGNVRAMRGARRPGPVSETATSGAGHYGRAAEQIDQIRLDTLHAAGYSGAGVVVGVLDTGFDRRHAAFSDPGHPIRVLAERDFLEGDDDTSQEPGDPRAQHEHGTYILGVLAANRPGLLVGGAPDASYVLAKVEEEAEEYVAEEDLFVAGLEWIEAQGADLASSSVVLYDHYPQSQLDGRTSVMTVGVNVATENGLHFFQGAGNHGHDADPETSRLVPPADALDAVSVGAVDAEGLTASFSSDGPTADGRQKPEILVRGADVWTVHAHGPERLVALDGTSLATPLAAAAAACLIQAHPEWTVADLRKALTRTADGYRRDGTSDPLFVRGYGILNARAALDFRFDEGKGR